VDYNTKISKFGLFSKGEWESGRRGEGEKRRREEIFTALTLINHGFHGGHG
jgi:hypothetical protein